MSVELRIIIPPKHSLYKGIHASGPVDLSACMGQISQGGFYPKYCKFFFKQFLYWFDYAASVFKNVLPKKNLGVKKRSESNVIQFYIARERELYE